MLLIIWFLIVAFLLSVSVTWLLDNNGYVVINWLGYQIQSDILTSILLSAFLALIIFAISYILARILSIKFPNFLKIFSRKVYLRRLEKLVKKYQKSFELLPELMLALEVGDKKASKDLSKKLLSLNKNPILNNFLLGKKSLLEGDFEKSAQAFEKFGENKHAKILVLKSKFYLALDKKDHTSAIAYARQIISTNLESPDVLNQLFLLYKKEGLWQEAKDLMKKFGEKKFKDEMQKRDIVVMNTSLAFEYYKKKKLSLAIKHAKIALKSEDNFLPALEVLLKSWVKKGYSLRVTWKLKSLWKLDPHIVFVEISEMLNRKNPAKKRIKFIKELIKSNDEDSSLANLAVALVAFNVGEYKIAKEFAYFSLSKEKNYRAYRIMAFVEKKLGNEDEYKKNLKQSEMLSKESHYNCSECGYSSLRWGSKCPSCGSYDSF